MRDARYMGVSSGAELEEQSTRMHGAQLPPVSAVFELASWQQAVLALAEEEARRLARIAPPECRAAVHLVERELRGRRAATRRGVAG